MIFPLLLYTLLILSVNARHVLAKDHACLDHVCYLRYILTLFAQKLFDATPTDFGDGYLLVAIGYLNYRLFHDRYCRQHEVARLLVNLLPPAV